MKSQLEIPSNFYEPLTIAVVMPHPWKGGFFRVACMLANMLSELDFRGRPISVILSVPPDYEYETTFLKPNVRVNSFLIQQVKSDDERFVSEEARNRLCSEGNELPVVSAVTTYPLRDTRLVDSIDGYILLNALFYEGVFVSTKPTAIYMADLIQRHVPAIYGAESNYDSPNWTADRNQRATLKNAHAVFTTTPGTKQDVLTYGGVSKSKHVDFPLFFIDIAEKHINSPKEVVGQFTDLLTGEKITPGESPYFLWVTNASPHKNQVNGLDMLRSYYDQGGDLDCYICGPVTELLVPGASALPYLQSVHAKIKSLGPLASRLKIVSYVNEGFYLELLRKAEFLWHNVLYDNGSFSIIEAKIVGTPILSSSYPQIKYIAETYDIGCEFFDPRSIEDGAASLAQMSRRKTRSKPTNMAINQVDFRKNLLSVLELMFPIKN
ncbi:glycosyltransferase [Ensifer canadensis]